MWWLLACRGALTEDPLPVVVVDPVLTDTAAPTAPAADEPVVPESGPPPVPAIAIAQLLPGEPARVTVAPVRPGARVRVALADGPGTTCVSSGPCFDLTGPLRQVAEGTGGPDGYAELFVTVPPTAIAGREVHVQALVDDPAGAVLSTPFDRRVGPAACGQTYDPACGWDGLTWPNRCAAAFEGWVVRSDDPC